MYRFIFIGIAMSMGCLVLSASAEEPKAKTDAKPPYERMLKGEDAKKAANLEKQILDLEAAQNLEQALQLAQEVLNFRTKRQGADHWQVRGAQIRVADLKRPPLTVEQRQRLANADKLDAQVINLNNQGKARDAIPLAEQSLAIRKELLGQKHANYAVSLNNLAYLYSSIGAFAKAEPLYKESQLIYKDVLGDKHPHYADTLNNLATLYESQGAYAKAEPLYQDALRIRKEVFGEKAPSYASSLNNLAMLYRFQGRYAKAQPLLEDALRIRLKALGEEHPETANSYNNIALNLLDQRRAAAAEPLFRKALAIHVKVLGEEHPNTASVHNNIGFSLQHQGKLAEADPLFRKALAIRLKALGEDHPDTAGSYNNVASNLQAQEKAAEAEPLFRKALAINRKVLGEEHPETASAYNSLAVSLHAQGKTADAELLFRKALAMRVKVLGEEHPDTVSSYNILAGNLEAQGKAGNAEPYCRKVLAIRVKLLGEEDPNTAAAYNNLAANLEAQGKTAEAEPLFRKALAICRKILGEEHPETALCCFNLAANLRVQGKKAEAEPLYRTSLAIRLKVRGEEHADTASSYIGLAAILSEMGKVAEAELLFRKALAISRRVRGEEHPVTAKNYLNLAASLHNQGKVAEAEPLIRRAIAIQLKVLGEMHPETARSYCDLAANLQAQEKASEAEPLVRKALDICLMVQGPKHPDTAFSYDKLALNLHAQGKGAEAEFFFRKALDIRVEVLGEEHLDTATTCNNLATNLAARGKASEAEPLLRKSLAIHQKLLGPEHVGTAASYNNLGCNLATQGKAPEGEPLLRKALAIYQKTKGEEHWRTVDIYNNLACNLSVQGKAAEAADVLERGIRTYEAARLTIAGRGLDRASFGVFKSPYRLLAATRLHVNKPAGAWAALEADLARGLLDELGSATAPLTAAEDARQRELSGKLQAIKPRLSQLVSAPNRSAPEQAELDALLRERGVLAGGLATLAVEISKREVASLAQIQVALAADTAWIAWLDFTEHSEAVQEHWVCVLRAAGEPKWEKLPGSGPDSKWTKDDGSLAGRLRDELSRPAPSRLVVGDLAKQFYAQRLAPAEKHLQGVKRLLAVPVNEMAGIPIEALIDKYTISYVPSGTFLARLKDRPAPAGSRILALGDPIFNAPMSKTIPVELPPGGLLILQVVPDGRAAKNGLQAGDVLLSYAGTELAALDQLPKLIESNASAQSVEIKIWRRSEKNKINTRVVPPGQLGVVLDNRPAREALVGRRKTEELTAWRGLGLTELPGTRIELNSISKLFKQNATILVDSDASEQKLEEMRLSGALSKFRYMHFGTHGTANNAQSFASVLYLSQDKLPKKPFNPLGDGELSTLLELARSHREPPKELQADSGKPLIDGQLSAREVMKYWKLDAELVTLSACETALGRQGGGDGLLGFAQAFLTAGARSVCLSLWKVDDTATALLMNRFYQNLLGKREGLSKPMPKAEALAEAKTWLRNLHYEDALKMTAMATNGIARGNRGKGEDVNLIVPKDAKVEAAAKDSKPFAHPKYWAAFILIGDPN